MKTLEARFSEHLDVVDRAIAQLERRGGYPLNLTATCVVPVPGDLSIVTGPAQSVMMVIGEIANMGHDGLIEVRKL